MHKFVLHDFTVMAYCELGRDGLSLKKNGSAEKKFGEH